MPERANVYPRLRASTNVSGPKHSPVSLSTMSLMTGASSQVSTSYTNWVRLSPRYLVCSKRDGRCMTPDASAETPRCDDDPVGTEIDFYFDPMCPWAYQTSVWIRDVRAQIDLDIHWRFFSLEEINRPEGKRHPWERPLAYGWTPMRVAAWLRRIDMSLCDRWYEACGRALHVDGRRFYERDVALDLLGSIGAPTMAWDEAIADPTTHDDVHADHDRAVSEYGGFGVPILVLQNGRCVFGPVVVPAPAGPEALKLWELCITYSEFGGLFELKTPKTSGDLRMIADQFHPYLTSRQWATIERPAP